MGGINSAKIHWAVHFKYIHFIVCKLSSTKLSLYKGALLGKYYPGNIGDVLHNYSIKILKILMKFNTHLRFFRNEKQQNYLGKPRIEENNLMFSIYQKASTKHNWC